MWLALVAPVPTWPDCPPQLPPAQTDREPGSTRMSTKKQRVSAALRALTDGDERTQLTVYLSRMPESELDVLSEEDTQQFVVDFLRLSAGRVLAILSGVTSCQDPSCPHVVF